MLTAMNNNVGAHSGGRLRITPTGTVRRLEYMGGHPLLAESALKAVKLESRQPLRNQPQQLK